MLTRRLRATSLTDWASSGLKTTTEKSADGMLRGIDPSLLPHGGRSEVASAWNRPCGRRRTLFPLAVDPNINAAYVLQPLEGRLALYRIALDGTLKSEPVFASKEVDVANVVRVGRRGRSSAPPMSPIAGRSNTSIPLTGRSRRHLPNRCPNCRCYSSSAPARMSASCWCAPAATWIPAITTISIVTGKYWPTSCRRGRRCRARHFLR